LKTKTASVRLPTEMFEEIDSICDGVGCSRNDWIKDTLKDKLRDENSQDQDQKPEELEPEVIITEITEPKPIVTEVPELTNAQIVIEPIDNSKNPVIEMVEFNGQLLSFAKRYEI